ncbi:MAG TPA: hypothetical protein VGV59_19070 [Pyrinomonadaceae bacterium]|nr:hypothetical protein [Pyrinomonadaceae bacterium]
MNRPSKRTPSLLLLLPLILMLFSAVGERLAAQTPPPSSASVSTPSAVVREFYKALRERRFREAFAMSILRPAFDPLNEQELAELRPDFERRAAEVPAVVELTGEQISGDEATVFMKIGEGDALKIEPVYLIREKGVWIIGDRNGKKEIEKSGKKYFFEARIEAHHSDVESLLQRFAAVQLVYSAQHGGQFGDLKQLVAAGLMPQDVLSTESTGYRFHAEVTNGGKSYVAGAEPVAYGRTGRLSYYLDASGLRSEDRGGKPLKASKPKK